MKALAAAVIREGSPLQSRKTGKLQIGDVIAVSKQLDVGGVVRVQFVPVDAK